jgi:hypothetical protein
MMPAREASIDWVKRALSEEIGERAVTGEELVQWAENLVAIAEHYGVAIEDLVQWIHFRSPLKEWTAAEWRRWCEKYVETRRELEKRMASNQ